MEKLVFRVYSKEPITGNNMRINDNIRRMINQIKRDTGLSATRIVEQCMRFAVENYEVEEV